MSFQPFLRAEVAQAFGLGKVAAVVGNEGDLEVQTAQPDQSPYVAQARVGAPGFPTGDTGLGGPGEVREFPLGEACAAARLTDQGTFESHHNSITDLLCR